MRVPLFQALTQGTLTAMLWFESLPFEMRARRVAAVSALAYVACGGHTDSSVTSLDTGGHMALPNTGGASGAGTAALPSLGGTFDVVRGSGGGSGTSCQSLIDDLDDSCVSDSDCTVVLDGNPCDANSCSGCVVGINVRAAEKYTADYSALAAMYGRPSLVCPCPCTIAVVCCRQGKCRNGCSDCN